MLRRIFLLLIAASPSAAQEPNSWSHAAAPGGQYEGSYSGTDGAYINYSCTSFSASLEIGANGMHVSKGSAKIEIDGAKIYEGQITYVTVYDISQVEFNLNAASHDYEKVQYQNMVSAMASGRELILSTPTGESFSYSLEGSSDIEVCLR